jgi:hypothetical protein
MTNLDSGIKMEKRKENNGEEKGDEKMAGDAYLKTILPLIVLVLLVTVTFWGVFFLTLTVINAIPIYGLSVCVPAIFSVFITGLVVIYIVKENVENG